MSRLSFGVGQSKRHKKIARNQQGFTLIELMIALVIFAMLALAGWQIMDSISKSRDRGNLHQQALSQLDYAYLQLSQDLAQTTNYVVMPIMSNIGNNTTVIGANTGIMPTFVLNESQISFIRFAAPDPRYQPSPVLAKVQYSLAGEKLTKQRFYHVNDPNETPASSVLLTGIRDASWKALTPDMVSQFPDEATLQKVQQRQAQKKANQGINSPATVSPNLSTNDNAQGNPTQNALQQTGIDLTPYQQLPRGVELTFTYQGEPITWRFALPNTAPSSANP